MVNLEKTLLDIAIGPRITESDATVIVIAVGVVIVAIAAVLVIRAVRKRKKHEQVQK